MNSVATERLRLGRPSPGGVREAPGGGCRARVRDGTDAPRPSATGEEGGMLASVRRPAGTRGSWRTGSGPQSASAAWSGRSYGARGHADQPRLLFRAPLALSAYRPPV